MTYDAIGYTGYKFRDGKLIPVEMVKAKPHNFRSEFAKLEKRTKKIRQDLKLDCLCAWALVYGFSIRIFLAL